jgi:hypothetical protein
MKFLQVPEWHYELPMTRQSGLASDSSNLGSDAGLPPLKKDLFLKDLDRAFVRRRPSQGSNSFSKPLYECSHRTKGAQDLHRPFVKTLRPGLQTMDNKSISSLSSQLAKSSSTSEAFSTAASRESQSSHRAKKVCVRWRAFQLLERFRILTSISLWAQEGQLVAW